MTLGLSWYHEAVALWLEGAEAQVAPLIECLADAYPDCTFERADTEEVATRSATQSWSAPLRLVPDCFPIRTFPSFEDRLNRKLADPLAGILSTLRSVGRMDASPTIRMCVGPAKGSHVRANERTLVRLQRGFRNAWLSNRYAASATSQRRSLRLASYVASKALGPGDAGTETLPALEKLKSHLFEVMIQLQVTASDSDVAQSRLAQLAGSFGCFTTPKGRFRTGMIRRSASRPRGRGFLMSAAEIATLWHPPVATVRVEKLPPSLLRELEPPLDIPLPQSHPTCTVLACLQYRHRREPFGIRLDDRRRHLAVIGKTGMGKSTLIERLVASDIELGRGVALIDPHGDLAETVTATVPRYRTNDVVLFDAADRIHPVAFNPLDCRYVENRPLVVSGILAAFKKLYGDSWGPRMEHIWRHALLAAIEHRGATLETVSQILSNGRFRQQMVEHVADPIVRRFWLEEFASWRPQLQAEAVAPIQNKLGQFLAHPILRNILVHSRSKLRLREVMDDGRVLIVNLSKGRIGEDASMLLGAMLVTELQLAAMSRADVLESERRDYFAYVDEFQNFATESFATILSEARKYRLSLVLANQYLGQMDEPTRDAVFGNVGSLLCFQVGATDSELLADQLGGDVRPTDLMNLPKFTAYLRLLIDGMPSRPFSIETLPPTRVCDPRRLEIIRRTSRHRYSVDHSPRHHGPVTSRLGT